MTARADGQAEFRLLPFQEEAAEGLRSAALNWVDHALACGAAPRYGVNAIPFLGQLRAVTGAGKTPILADVVSGLGAGLVVWTSKSAVVVEQTFRNLRSRYSRLLPQDVRVIREVPSATEWQHLLESETGLTIWVMTTASWNEAEAAAKGGDATARLSLHRPQQDWAGTESPWESLRTRVKRPIWVVSDESHNQSSTQLDLLAALQPIGFFMASATPVQNELFAKWQDALSTDPEWARLAEAGVVKVRTRDVVEAELLKTTIELYDNNSGYEEDLDGVLQCVEALDEAVAAESAQMRPKAIYVVEKSNPPKGSLEEARPVIIWRFLRSRGVPASEIAVFTRTRDVPEDAEVMTSLTQLSPRHRHIIFNQALQEGWDDPEAYVAYFDGKTESFVRIRQIVGRILRQPRARRLNAERLNTATVFLNSPTESFDKVLTGLKEELRLYAPEDEPYAVPIRVKTRSTPLDPIAVKPGYESLGLPRRALKAPEMAPMEERLLSRGGSPWEATYLEALGQGRVSIVSLAREDIERTELLQVLRAARTKNGVYLRRRLLSMNRSALNAIHPDAMNGPAYEQQSCQGSLAQVELEELARTVALYFEDRVDYQDDPDPDESIWRIAPHRPKSGDLVPFTHAAHDAYSRADFNTDELAFAQELDAFGEGVWMRNPSTATTGYGIPLPLKVGDSSRFYPDFLWWAGDTCWGLDTTGRHLLNDKIRGKLVGIQDPRLALVVRGRVDVARSSLTDKTGWTLVVARPALEPLVEQHGELRQIFEVLVRL
jgi:type III restriction enzyme